MNAFQACPNTSDAIPLYLPQQLYLKPCASICITVQLSEKLIGKTIIHGEIIQKLKALIQPDKFAHVRVSKATLESVCLDAELELRSYMQRILAKLDHKSIRLKDIDSLLKVKACEMKSDFPTRHEWDAFFRDASDMNEMKCGERPDTVHLVNLPTKWFLIRPLKPDEEELPSEKLLYYVFEKFGSIRRIDIPICDPYRCKMKAHISGMQATTFDKTEFFEGYVQFKDYLGFVKCMDALRGMLLIRKEPNGEADAVRMGVTFDRTKHLTDASVRRRDIVRDRLILRQRTLEQAAEVQEETEKKKNDDLKKGKEQRRREREERRKAKILAQLKGKQSVSDEYNEKIANEEKKLLKVQRRLEAIRLVEDLFQRLVNKLDLSSTSKDASKPKKSRGSANELQQMRLTYEEAVKSQRDKLHKAIEGGVLLRSIVSTTTREVCSDVEKGSSDDDSIGDPRRDAQKVYPTRPINAGPAIDELYPYYWQNQLMAYSAAAAAAHVNNRGYYFPGRNGGNRRGYHGAGPSSGGYARPYRPQRGRGRYQRNNYNHSRYSQSRSRSRSRSHSKYRSRSSRSRSRTRSKSRTRYKRSRDRSWSRRRSSYSSSSKSKSRSRSKSRARWSSRSRTPRTPSRSKRRASKSSRSRSRTS